MRVSKLLPFVAFVLWISGCDKSDIEFRRTDSLKSKFEAQNELQPAPMNVYFGNLHSHTKYSDGNGTPAEALVWARDVAKFDFYAITDHAELTTTTEWNDIGVQVSRFTQNDVFVAIRGFEWTSLQGHVNVFNTSNYTSADVTTTIDEVYEWVNRNHGFCQLNHPGWANETLNNLKYNPVVASNCITIDSDTESRHNRN